MNCCSKKQKETQINVKTSHAQGLEDNIVKSTTNMICRVNVSLYQNPKAFFIEVENLTQNPYRLSGAPNIQNNLGKEKQRGRIHFLISKLTTNINELK